MERCVLLARAVVLAALLGASATQARGFEPILESKKEAMIDKLRGKLKEQDAPEGMLSHLVQMEVANQISCRFRASNPHKVDLWNVEVSFEPTNRAKRTQHLPLLPAGTSVEVSFDCGYSRGGGFDGIVVGDIRLDSEDMDELISTEADTRFDGNLFSEAKLDSNVAQGALSLLAFAQPGSARAFVGSLLENEKGPVTLATFLAAAPSQSALDSIAKALRELEPSAVMEFLMAQLEVSGERTPEVNALIDELLAKLCGTLTNEGRRREALWEAALTHSGTEDFRATFIARCQPRGRALQRTTEVLVGTPALAGPVLERTDPVSFQALSRALARSQEGLTALYHFLRTTSDAGRFDTVTSLIPPDERRVAVLELARSEPSSIDAHKAAFLGQALDGLKADRPEVVREPIMELTKLVSSNSVPLSAMREVIIERQGWASEEISKSLEAEVARRPTPFKLSGGKLPPGVEPMDYLTEILPQLEGCEKSLTRAQECTDVLARNEALTTGAGLTPEFLAGMTSLLSQEDPLTPTFLRMARQYAGWGLDLEPVVQRVCDLALQEDTRPAGDEDKLLLRAAELKPEAACIGKARSSLRWAAAANTFAWTLKGLALLVPMAGLIFLARKQLKPVVEQREKSLPDTSHVTGPGTVSSRLAGPSWARGLEDALSEARKAFTEDASTPGALAAQLLTGLRDAVPLLAAQAQTLAGEAVTRGTVRSVLLHREDAVVYLVAVPARYEQPQTLRHFPGFSEGWAPHVGRLARALPADSADKPLLAVVLFVEPDASQVTAVFGLEARGAQRLLPGALLDEREAKRADGRVHPHRGVFALEAAPPPAPVGDDKDSKAAERA